VHRAPVRSPGVAGELAGLTEKAAAEATAVLRNGRRAVPRALSARVRRWLVRARREWRSRSSGQARSWRRPGPGRADTRKRDPAGQPARPRRPPDPRKAHRQADGVRL
jgi:hypothetical protein